MKVINILKTYGFKIFTEQYSPKNIKYELQYSLSNFISFFYSLPLDLKFIFKKIRSDKFYSHIELHGYDKFLRTLDINSNKFVLTILFAVLMISGALTIDVPSSRMIRLLGIPLISLISFIFAAFFSFILIIYMIRHRNKKKKN